MIHILHIFFPRRVFDDCPSRPVFVLSRRNSTVSRVAMGFFRFRRGFFGSDGVFSVSMGVDGVRGDRAETTVSYGVCVWHRSVYLYREKEEKAIAPCRDVSYMSDNLSKYNALCHIYIIQWIIMSIRKNVRDLFMIFLNFSWKIMFEFFAYDLCGKKLDWILLLMCYVLKLIVRNWEIYTE